MQRRAMPAALPLLEFLLEELYKRRSHDNVLTFRAYEELGGVAGALARRAEEVLEAVSPEARDTLPLVLRELVSLSVEDDATALRRVAPLAAFTSAPARELVRALLEARLFVSISTTAGSRWFLSRTRRCSSIGRGCAAGASRIASTCARMRACRRRCGRGRGKAGVATSCCRAASRSPRRAH